SIPLRCIEATTGVSSSSGQSLQAGGALLFPLDQLNSAFAAYHLGGHDAAFDGAARRQIEHGPPEYLLHDPAQAAGAGVAGNRLFGNLDQSVLGEFQLDV